MNQTGTVSIGRNVGTSPMLDEEWGAYRYEVDQAIATSSDEVFVRSALGGGRWENVEEDNATWVFSVAESSLQGLRRMLAVLAGRYQQDAIALTLGATELLAGEVA